jgi:hypothetical protein
MGVAATASPRTWLGIQLGHRFGDDTVHRNELIGDLRSRFFLEHRGEREEPGRFEQDKKASGTVIGSVNGERIRSPRRDQALFLFFLGFLMLMIFACHYVQVFLSVFK